MIYTAVLIVVNTRTYGRGAFIDRRSIVRVLLSDPGIFPDSPDSRVCTCALVFRSLLSKLLVIFLAVRIFETKSSGNCVDPSAECVVDVCQNITQFRRILIQRFVEFCKID